MEKIRISAMEWRTHLGNRGKIIHTINSITRLIIRSFLLLTNLSAVEAITRLTASWPTEASCMIEEKMMNSHPRHMFIQDIGSLHLIALDCLTQLEIFVLGYYYVVLSSLVDVTQLPVQEAYGAWVGTIPRF